jgi:formate-dependent nitrite reductase membrane component NrfD
MSESVTGVGTQMQSYYGRPIVKEPVWKPEIPAYLFTGGVAGGCSLLHGFARIAGHDRLARTALYVGAGADVISPALLVSDLGRPERFHHMFRVFKVTSPMSVGSWIISAEGGLLTLTAAHEFLGWFPRPLARAAAALELTGRLRPVKWAAELVSFLAGAPLATYTGTLLADTAIPVWHSARKELPWLFGASAAASAGAATTMFMPAGEAGPARRLAVAAVAAELGLMETMQHRLGFVGEVYEQGAAGKLARASKALAAAGGALLATRGRRSRGAAVAGSALVLAAELALRWSVFRAGFQSARDPRYTVVPQKRRQDDALTKG